MNGVLGSLPNSKRTIELELLRIIVQNLRLDSLISAQSDNAKLMNALPLVQSRLTTGSLAAYDGFDFNELYHFMQNFHQNIDNTITTGSEEFQGEMLTPRNRVLLSNATYELLVKYYNDIYDWNFTSIADLASSDLSSGDSNQSIDDESIDIYPGHVQYYFEHTVQLPIGPKTHRLTFVNWYLWAPNEKTRFHCRIGNWDDKSCNVELWKYDFHELSRDAIMPIHNIYSRFLPSKFTVGTRNPTTYMAVIPINRQFHL
ncbi:hypothetical protein RhiirC2_770368 [Rhizophagus irregularis]|uniref:Uncharacterized protein n=1 Tax=Rhizophagus irregularis TaxID=588596 RepID=A0A2N1NWL5_9GLOM|nr:hypothetical protein RhiirC2_770368 [Rhizophagus irregularis]